MRKLSLFVAKVLVLVVFVVPIHTKAAVNPEEERALLLQLIALLQQQITILQAQLTAETQTYVLTSGQSETLSAQVDVVASYHISRPEEINQIVNPVHRAYFKRVETLIPQTYMSRFRQLAVFRGGDTPFDAFVETIPPDHKTWRYEVSEDMLSKPTSDWNTELIVHELGHVISYDPIPGVPESEQVHCATYFQARGCPLDNSYLAQFVDRFWNASNLRRAEQLTHRADRDEAAYTYYKSHPFNFVSDYAVTAPEEDFAESFMYFALGKQVEGKEANEKIDFFAQYSDLRATRLAIRENR